jgi:hypothetical protein
MGNFICDSAHGIFILETGTHQCCRIDDVASTMRCDAATLTVRQIVDTVCMRQSRKIFHSFAIQRTAFLFLETGTQQCCRIDDTVRDTVTLTVHARFVLRHKISCRRCREQNVIIQI